MTTEAERYLRKARESLASARADLRAKRYNSAANRAYYASFQAAVSALIHWKVRSPDTDWEHRFVSAEFSSKLIRRRKVFTADLASTLPDLFGARIEADYRARETSARTASRAVDRAARFVDSVEAAETRRELREARAEYGEEMNTKTPLEYVDDAKRTILESYPDVDFKVKPRNPRDFTLEVYGDYPEMSEVREGLGDFIIDTLVDHDVWIVVLCLPRTLPD